MGSNPALQLFFIYQLENIFRSYLNFSTSYGRLTDLKSLLGLSLVNFICQDGVDIAYAQTG